MFEARAAKAKDGSAASSKLVFKKRMFRETDESVTEPRFVALSYIQAQHDYLQVGGAYPPRSRAKDFRVPAPVAHPDLASG